MSPRDVDLFGRPVHRPAVQIPLSIPLTAEELEEIALQARRDKRAKVIELDPMTVELFPEG